jgi:hypothetical protein
MMFARYIGDEILKGLYEDGDAPKIPELPGSGTRSEAGNRRLKASQRRLLDILPDGRKTLKGSRKGRISVSVGHDDGKGGKH